MGRKGKLPQGAVVDPAIAAGLQRAGMAEQMAIMQQKQAEDEQKRQNLMVRGFIWDTTKQLYVNGCTYAQEELEDATFRKIARNAQEAAFVLAEEMGLIENREDMKARLAKEAEEAAAEEEDSEPSTIIMPGDE